MFTGLIETTGTLVDLKFRRGSAKVRISCRFPRSGEAGRGTLSVGESVAVGGACLTVSVVGRGWFEVMLVPHTLRATTMSQREPGDELNIETDLIAKYVRSLLGARSVS